MFYNNKNKLHYKMIIKILLNNIFTKNSFLNSFSFSKLFYVNNKILYLQFNS